MEEQFLDETGLRKVAENVNSRLKTVAVMPVNPKDGQIVLYVGESGMAYTKGCTYQFDESEDEWMDITAELTVDGTYNPQSENAQSGVALSQAQNVLINKLFRESWKNKTWTGPLNSFVGEYVWYDGDTAYYSSGSNQYVFNKNTNEWESKTWEGLTRFDGINVWRDNDNNLYTRGQYSYQQYTYDRNQDKWVQISWNGDYTTPAGNGIWHNGSTIYFSWYTTQCVLDISTLTLTNVTWQGLTELYGNNIWYDDDNIYYSNGLNQYILNKSTNVWEPKIWHGLPDLNTFNFSGQFIWKDNNDNIYFSNGTSQYAFNKSTDTWEEKNWDNAPMLLLGTNIWKSGNDIYSSDNSDQYILGKSIKTYID